MFRSPLPYPTLVRIKTWLSALAFTALAACGGDDGATPRDRAQPGMSTPATGQRAVEAAKTGTTVRDFALQADGVELAPPYTADRAQSIRVVPSAAGAGASVVYWGDGEYSSVQGGWNPNTPPDALAHRYAAPGAYRVEYATLVDGTWDSRVVGLTLEGETTPPAPTFDRSFVLQSNGSPVSDTTPIAVGQVVQVVPASDAAAASVAYWGDGTYTSISGGWRPGVDLGHAYASAGRYTIEYATLSPGGAWDSRLVAITVGTVDPPPPPPATFSREFALTGVDGTPLPTPVKLAAPATVRVLPADTHAQVSLIYWGDGATATIQGGFKADTPANLLTHTYAQPGSYRIEYATLSPLGTWDSRLATVEVTPDTQPPRPTPQWTTVPFPDAGDPFGWYRRFTLVSGGDLLHAWGPGGQSLDQFAARAVTGQDVTVMPYTNVGGPEPTVGIIYWGDGSSTTIEGGWRPTTPTSLTTHRYAAPGTYRVEYASLSPDNRWDSWLVALTVAAGTPPAAPPPFTSVPPLPSIPGNPSLAFAATADYSTLLSVDHVAGTVVANDVPMPDEWSTRASVLSADARTLYRAVAPLSSNDPFVPVAVRAYSLDATRGLVPVGRSVNIENAGVDALVVAPSGRTLYVFASPYGFTAPAYVTAYRLDPTTGAIGARVAQVRLPAAAWRTTIDPTGEWMLVGPATWQTNVLRLDPSTGAVLSQRMIAAPLAAQPLSLRMHPGGNWVSSHDDTTLVTMRFDRATGQLSAGSAYSIARPFLLATGGRFATADLYVEGLAVIPRDDNTNDVPGALLRLPFDAATGQLATTATPLWTEARYVCTIDPFARSVLLAGSTDHGYELYAITGSATQASWATLRASGTVPGPVSDLAPAPFCDMTK
jgi:hypothetical protein